MAKRPPTIPDSELDVLKVLWDLGQATVREALETLRGVEGIATVRFSDEDVVRHGLVARIVRAYEARRRAADDGEQL